MNLVRSLARAQAQTGDDLTSAVPLQRRSNRAMPPSALLVPEWEEVLHGWGQPRFRATQIFRWIHAHREFDTAKMTNLPVELRGRLQAEGLTPAVETASVDRAQDGTRKLLLRLSDGQMVECVLIAMSHREPDWSADSIDASNSGVSPDPASTRVTLCVSTQCGCAMGCVFCASGQAGLRRNLEPQEIEGQVLEAHRHLLPGEVLTNLVFMGMGEPLHNYEATARSIRLLSHPEGQSFGTRRITVSTVGLPQGIRRLGQDFDGKVGLAVSLHAPNDELRNRIVPLNLKVPLERILGTLREYPLPRRRRFTIEYTLIDGINDQPDHAEHLARLLRGLRVKVNLISMNPISGSSWRGSSDERMEQFRERLAAHGYSCFVRARRGQALSAACGQLALHGAE